MSKTNNKLILLGTGTPVPNLERYPSAEIVYINGIPILVDCGEGATRQMMKTGVNPQDVQHVFFTHLHCDHMLGYGQFLIGGWTMGRTELTVYGPKGTKEFHDAVVSTLMSDVKYRNSLGRPSEGILDVNVIEIESAGKVEADLPFDITCENMIHFEPTFAYRFETDDISIVFSGDTAPTDSLIDLSKDADIILHECALASNSAYTSPDEGTQRIWRSLQQEHCTPEQAANTAKQANVQKLVLNHFLPNINEEKVLNEVKETYSGEVVIGHDLDEIYF